LRRREQVRVERVGQVEVSVVNGEAAAATLD
jgi:hypothetical protein